MANSFVHLELATPDMVKAKEFYSGMFGWAFKDIYMGPGGVYSTFKAGDGPGGGMLTMPGAPTAWLAYVGVDDVHAATAKAKELGAQVMRDVTEVPEMGWFSMLIDPTGAAIALWQAK